MASLASTSPRRHAAAAVAVLAVAALARAWRLGTQVITSDESFSWRLAGYPVADIAERTAADVHSPLFYVLLKGWLAVAGTSVVGLRLPAVLLTLLVVALAWRVVREATGALAAGAIVAAAFVALHPLQVQQGRNARMYALGLVLAAAGTLVLQRAVRDPGPARRWLAWGVLSALLVFTHYYGAFTVAAQGVGALAMATRETRARVLRGVGVAAAVCLALLAPWLPTMLAQARRVQEDYWIPPATGAGLGAALLHWTTGLEKGPLAGIAALGVVALVVAAARREPRRIVFFAAPAVLPWVLALAVSAASGRPLLMERFTVFAHLALALLLGAAWDVVRPRAAVGAALAVLLLATTTAGLRHALQDVGADPPALPRAVEVLKGAHGAGDAVVAESPRLLNKFLFYWSAAGGGPVRAHCEPTGLGGHYSHAAALAPGDVLPSRADDLHVARVWRLSERAAALAPLEPARWIPASDDLVEGGEGTVVRLVRADRR